MHQHIHERNTYCGESSLEKLSCDLSVLLLSESIAFLFRVLPEVLLRHSSSCKAPLSARAMKRNISQPQQQTPFSKYYHRRLKVDCQLECNLYPKVSLFHNMSTFCHKIQDDSLEACKLLFVVQLSGTLHHR